MLFFLIPLISSGYCFNESIYSGRSQYSINTITNISYCFFTRINSSTGNGGVLYFNTMVGNLYMEYTGFYNIGSSGVGGAFYLILESVRISYCCANSCYGVYFHYGYIKVSNSTGLEFQSISYCSKSITGYTSLMTAGGDIIINNLNSSMNIASRFAGMDSYQTSGFLCSFSTFAHNNVSEYSCLGFNMNMAEIKRINIIDNTSPSRGIIYVRGDAKLTIEEAVMNQNKNILLYTLGGFITVCNSYIYHDLPYIGSGTLINISSISIPPFQFEFFSTKYCISDPDESKTLSIHNNYQTTTFKIPIFQIIIILP